jgi:ubiquinone/menaquinone biosynthesis C-methylase UbiE
MEFSKKYHSDEFAQNYYNKHVSGFWRKLSNRLEQGTARKALVLAGNPQSILDIPCGAGRFWDMLAENQSRRLYAMDNSQHMIDAAMARQNQVTSDRFEACQASAFEIPLADNAVECVFCIRLFHHIGRHEDRLALLAELSRVTSDTIILSLWVDGNYLAWRRKKKEKHRKKQRYQNRFVVPASEFERGISESGLRIEKRLDMLPYMSMWRTYVLRK